MGLEAVAGDLRRRGAALSVLCPPAVDTPMVRNLPCHPALYSLFASAVQRAVVETVMRPRASTALIATPGQAGASRDLRARATRRGFTGGW